MLDSSLERELLRQLVEENNIFQQAASMKSQLQRIVESGGSAMQAKVTVAEQVAAMLQDAADRLAQHVASRTSAVALAEVELETRQSAVASQEQDSAQAIEVRRQAQSALRAAQAALGTHTQDATRRARTHGAKVQRAERRCSRARRCWHPLELGLRGHAPGRRGAHRACSATCTISAAAIHAAAIFLVRKHRPARYAEWCIHPGQQLSASNDGSALLDLQTAGAAQAPQPEPRKRHRTKFIYI